MVVRSADSRISLCLKSGLCQVLAVTLTQFLNALSPLLSLRFLICEMGIINHSIYLRAVVRIAGVST